MTSSLTSSSSLTSPPLTSSPLTTSLTSRPRRRLTTSLCRAVVSTVSAAPSLPSSPLSPAADATQPTFLRDLATLAKPGITLSAVILAAVAFALAGGGHGDFIALIVRGSICVAGTALLVMAAGAFNMVLERDVDVRMARTKDRPVAAGRMSAATATAIGALWALLSVPPLALLRPASAPPIALGLGLFSLFLYVLVYTPMKQRSMWALVVGAVPGAMPALIGGTLANGTVEAVGLGLFVVILLWQLPHFLAISLYREREYTDAGHKVSVQTFGVAGTKLLIVGTTFLSVAASLGLVVIGVGGAVYAVLALALGGWWFTSALRAVPDLMRRKATARSDDDDWARTVFRRSLVWQVGLLASLVIDSFVALF